VQKTCRGWWVGASSHVVPPGLRCMQGQGMRRMLGQEVVWKRCKCVGIWRMCGTSHSLQSCRTIVQQHAQRASRLVSKVGCACLPGFRSTHTLSPTPQHTCTRIHTRAHTHTQTHARTRTYPHPPRKWSSRSLAAQLEAPPVLRMLRRLMFLVGGFLRRMGAVRGGEG